MATSPKRESILEYRQIPVAGESDLKLQQVIVYTTGEAVASITHGKCAGDSKCMTVVKTTHFDAYEMDEIFQLAEAVRKGKVEIENPEIYCFVASPYIHSYTAERGRTTLYKGHVCNGPIQIQKGRAAIRLRSILQKLIREAFANDSQWIAAN